MAVEPTWGCADVLDSTARGVRAGLSLAAALDATASRGALPPSLADALAAHRTGRPLAACLDDARVGPVAASGVDDAGAVHLMLTVLSVAATHGGPSSQALDRAAATLRERAALTHEAQAHAAAARLSSRVLTAVPLAFAGFAVVADPRVREVLLTTPLGWACVVAGCGLNLVGRRWMSRIVADVAAPQVAR